MCVCVCVCVCRRAVVFLEGEAEVLGLFLMCRTEHVPQDFRTWTEPGGHFSLLLLSILYIYTYTYLYIHMYIYMYVCIYICLCVYILYTYIIHI